MVTTVKEANEILSAVVFDDKTAEALKFLTTHAEKQFMASSKQIYLINKMCDDNNISLEEVKAQLNLSLDDAITKKDASAIIKALKS